MEEAENPFELKLTVKKGRPAGDKIFGLSEPIGFEIASDFNELKNGRLMLSCGDLSSFGLPTGSVDAIITDPPFFDNVHYSQLADFFHVWQRYILGENGHQHACSTRSCEEVQNSDRAEYTKRLAAVLGEAHRVLKDEGVMALTYHHSRSDGWRSILEAIMFSGFVISAGHPWKAESAGAGSKLQAKEPINLDIIIVCRKRSKEISKKCGGLGDAVESARIQVNRLKVAGRKMSRNDVRIVLMSHVLKAVSAGSIEAALEVIDREEKEIENRIDEFFGEMQG